MTRSPGACGLGRGLVLALLLLPALARAQRGVDVQTFHPALDSYGIFEVDRSNVAEPFGYGFTLGLSYAANPLRLNMSAASDPSKTPPTVLISRMGSIELGGQLGLTRWLELVFSFPLSAQSYTTAYGRYGSNADPTIARTGFYAADRYTNVPPPNAAPGDGRAGFKARLFHAGGFGLGAAAIVTVPFGDDSAFLGDSNYTFRPELIADFTQRAFSIAANLGAIVRQETRVYNPYDVANGVTRPRLLIDVGDELTAAVGVSVRVIDQVALAAELVARIPVAGVVRDYTGDALGGLKIFPGRDVTLDVGAGAGFLTAAHRRDDYRLFLLVSWAPVREGGRDSDGDGVPDSIDLCPHDPEDHDGFEDSDGCPELDNDQDGIPDAKDRCPNEPEDRDGFEDGDGCPELDNDRDGIMDAQDRCPNEPEDRDGFEDGDGCPDLDNDGDGIADAQDRCPNEPETRNGVDDEDGCPEGEGAVAGGPVDLSTTIGFAPQKVVPLAGSDALLDHVADRIKAHSAVRRVRIEGHADLTEVPAARAMALSQERALAIRAALIRRGVEPERLQAVGYGSSRPLDNHRTLEARAKNRRVEFIIVEQ